MAALFDEMGLGGERHLGIMGLSIGLYFTSILDFWVNFARS
jgi:hypothetical protein